MHHRLKEGRRAKLSTKKAKDMKGTMRRIWQYMAKEKGLFFLVMVMILISSALALIGPYLLGVAVDGVISGWGGEQLFPMLAWLVLIFVLQSGAIFFQNYWMIGIAQNVVFFMRNHLFSHLQKLPVAFFQKRQHGELMSRLTNDMENVSRTLNAAVIQVITSTLTLVGTIIVMLFLSPLLTFLTLLIVPVLFAGMKWITNRTGAYFKEQQRELGDMNGYIEETISGQKIIKMYSQESRVIEEFEEKNEALRVSSYWAQTYSGFIPKLMNMLNNVSFTIIVGVGGILAVKGVVSIGVIVTFTTYSRQFTRPLNDLANQFNMILSAIAGAERVFQIMDEEKEAVDETEAVDISSLDGEIVFEHVSFSYEEDVATLKNVSFRAAPGQTIALVGPTGAGKTTVISLLSRFYDADEGTIYVDGEDIKNITRRSLRKQTAFVLQDSVLFRTTVRENIRYGNLVATDEEVVEAAKKANAHEFIIKLPDGYDTVLSSEGSDLSHGQRQLLSIARAMLADPSLLILDEATSSIDTITEMKITDALTKLMEGRTSFVIAHRLNTIQNADLIIVLKDGQVIEQGTDRTLLEKNGFYADLVRSQRQKGIG
ncbi:ABC transporter ATP-binding protein [Robertmurraya kyonggiensis]|uniref:ABC transporter ATP-binding protein n=1 Tax=Robertmurraya kyonggiensis TaxID=1037680 RepID=A0A4U1D4R7_9BACI|nr:ABC transporter ATP-binding protein [Robertmurraya kyonggiensis]TKC16838.1 ABC transporter ATP-binding protein [Robertmurraya kyonggiensis]